MSYPGQVFEDPEYYDDEDGCGADLLEEEPEDEPADVMAWLVKQLKDYDATYSPFDTINS